MQTKTLFQRSLLAVATAALITSLPVIAHNAEQPPMKKILRQLDLTDQQRAQVRNLMQEVRSDAQTVHQDQALIKEQLKNAIQAQNWNEEVVTALILQKQTAKEKLALTRAVSQNTLWNQLDDQQQEKFESLVDKRQKRDRNRAPLRRFEPLNLSQEQYSEIEALINRQKEQITEQQKVSKPFRKQQVELIQADDFNQQAWLASHQTMQSMQLELAVNVAHTRHKIWNILTPDQQLKMQEVAQKRQQKIEDKKRKMEQRKGRM